MWSFERENEINSFRSWPGDFCTSLRDWQLAAVILKTEEKVGNEDHWRMSLRVNCLRG